MPIKLTLGLNLPLMVVHEFCHYAAARLLRMPAKFHSYHVTFHPNGAPVQRVIFVMLAPAIFGGVFTFVLIAVAILLQKWLVIPATLLAGICWALTCSSDLHNVGHFIRCSEWPAELWQAPDTPQTLGDWLRQKDRI